MSDSNPCSGLGRGSKRQEERETRRSRGKPALDGRRALRDAEELPGQKDCPREGTAGARALRHECGAVGKRPRLDPKRTRRRQGSCRRRGTGCSSPGVQGGQWGFRGGCPARGGQPGAGRVGEFSTRAVRSRAVGTRGHSRGGQGLKWETFHGGTHWCGGQDALHCGPRPERPQTALALETGAQRSPCPLRGHPPPPPGELRGP